MIKAVLSRTYNANETIGMLWVVDGIKLLYRCKTIELPDNGNQPNVSCVPEGIYDVVKYLSPEKGKVFLLKDVPGRSNIEIHIGNYKKDTKGCILPGTFFVDIDNDQIPDVGESTKALGCLMEVCPNEFKIYII
jgi:hypothetical protein